MRGAGSGRSGKMAPSSKAERGGPGGKRGAAGGAGPGAAPRGRREHLVRQLDRVRVSGEAEGTVGDREGVLKWDVRGVSVRGP